MDIALRFHQLWAFLGLPKGILKLPLRNPGIFNHEQSKTVVGLLLILASALCAKGAHQVSITTGRQEWEKRHAPGPKIWEYALFSRGYHSVTLESAFLNRTRFLSSLALENPAKIWFNPQQACVALFDEPGESISKLYCKKPMRNSAVASNDPVVSIWEPLGSGWAGFETIIGRLDQSKNETLNPKPARQLYDSREVRY